ncbi:hypothetical protein EYC08_18130 [Tabrizicola sp. WMC-M-20]|nr:hypothetical protein EYC08_18130 [Tabrizicola sp. WMC-M-20]
MFQKIALAERISRNTAEQLHRYMMDFAEGTHRLFWIEQRAYVEVDRESDADLVRRQFPKLVQAETHYTGKTFP